MKVFGYLDDFIVWFFPISQTWGAFGISILKIFGFVVILYLIMWVLEKYILLKGVRYQ